MLDVSRHLAHPNARRSTVDVVPATPKSIHNHAELAAVIVVVRLRGPPKLEAVRCAVDPFEKVVGADSLQSQPQTALLHLGSADRRACIEHKS